MGAGPRGGLWACLAPEVLRGRSGGLGDAGPSVQWCQRTWSSPRSRVTFGSGSPWLRPRPGPPLTCFLFLWVPRFRAVLGRGGAGHAAPRPLVAGLSSRRGDFRRMRGGAGAAPGRPRPSSASFAGGRWGSTPTTHSPPTPATANAHASIWTRAHTGSGVAGVAGSSRGAARLFSASYAPRGRVRVRVSPHPLHPPPRPEPSASPAAGGHPRVREAGACR